MKKAKVKFIIMIVIVLLLGVGLFIGYVALNDKWTWLLNSLTNKYAILIYSLIGVTALMLTFQYIKGKKL